MIQWIDSILPSYVFSLGTGSLICAETIKFDAGAIAASVYLGLVAFLVVLGEEISKLQLLLKCFYAFVF